MAQGVYAQTVGGEGAQNPASVQLVDALESWATSTQLNLLYRPEIIPDITVSCTEARAEERLRCMVAAANLDYYRTSAGSYVVVLPRPIQAAPKGRAMGTVRDAVTQEPLPFANVYFPDLEQGTTTDQEGTFVLEDVPLGEEQVSVSYLGYETYTTDLAIHPGQRAAYGIALQPNVVHAAPVVVNGIQRLSQRLGEGHTDAQRTVLGGTYGTRDVAQRTSAVMGVSMRMPTTDLHIQGGEANEHQMQLDGIPVFNPVSLGRWLGAFSPLAIGRMTVHKSGFRASEGSQISGIVRMEHDLGLAEDYVRIQADPVSWNGRMRLDYALPFGMTASTMVAMRSSLWNMHQAATLDNMLSQWNSVDPLLSSLVLELTAPYLQYQSEWQGADVAFQDVHVASSVRLRPQHSLHLSGYSGTNALRTEFLGNEPTYVLRANNQVDITNVKRELLGLEPAIVNENQRRYLLTRDQYDWSNRGGQVRYEGLWGERIWTTLQARHSRYALMHAYKMTDQVVAFSPFGRAKTQLVQQQLRLTLDVEDGAEDDNHNTELAIEGAVFMDASATRNVELGFEVARATNHFRMDSLFFNPVTLSSDQWRLAGYWQETLNLDEATLVELGLRFTGIPDRDKTYLEPRAAIHYDFGETPIGVVASRIAGGIYRQFMSPFDVSNVGPSAIVPSLRFWLPIDHSVAPPTAYHLASEVSVMPHPYWQLHMEAYRKWQPRILSVDYAALFDPSSDPLEGDVQAEFITETDGFVHGGGVRVQHEQEGVRFALAYHYMHAERRFPGRFSNGREPTPWNEPHRLTLNAEIDAMDGLTFRLRTLGVWGRSWGFRQAYYDYFAAHASLTAFQPFDLADPSEHTLPPLRQLDVGVSYAYEVDGMSIVMQADFINVLNRINVVDWGLERADNNPDYPFLGGTQRYRKAERTLSGFTPVLSLSVGF